jgi:hypothetical protein
LAASFLQFGWTDTTIQVRKRAMGGLVSFLVGITSAIASLVILRRAPPPSSPQEPILLERIEPEVYHVRSPPPHAFRFPWNTYLEDMPFMAPLEEPPAPSDVPSSPSTPELVDEEEDIVLTTGLSFFSRIIVGETALCAVAALIPALYMPLVKLSYTGLAASLMKSPSLTPFLWQVPMMLWRQGLEAQTEHWKLVLFGLVLGLSLVILPALAFCLALLSWVGEGSCSRTSRQLLYSIHPALGGPVLALTLLVTIPSLKDLLLGDDTVCEKFFQALGETCLGLTGRFLPGFWFYLVHVVLLEAFCVLTLHWSQ